MNEYKRKAVEKLLYEIEKNSRENNNCGAVNNTNRTLLFKVFFEIYDIIENTNHSDCVKGLYFSKTGGTENLEKLAQRFNMDISTLRRYRIKYMSVSSAIFDCSKDSFTYELLRKMRNRLL